MHRYCNRNDAVLAIISEWTLRSMRIAIALFAISYLHTYVRDSELFRECAIYFHLFIFKWVYLPILHVRDPAMQYARTMMIFDWYICTHDEKIRNKRQRATANVIRAALSSILSVARPNIRETRLHYATLMRLLTRLMIVARLSRR